MTKEKAREICIEEWSRFLNTTLVNQMIEQLSLFLKQKIKHFKAKRRLLVYMPMKNELDYTSLFRQESISKFFIYYLPRILDKEKREMDFFLYRPDDSQENTLKKGNYGIYEPLLEQNLEYPLCKEDISIIPTLGINTKAYRLGKGWGYYDRKKEVLEKSTSLVLLPEKLSYLNFQEKEHDMQLDILITEKNIKKLSP